MLRAAQVRPDGLAVELGPGFSTKVGHGLREVGFHGELLVVDPNPEAREFTVRRYRELLPRARVGSLAEPRTHATPVELLLGNHVLDDMVLRRMLSPVPSNALFAEMRPGAPCSAAFVRSWRRILDNDPATVEAAVRATVHELAAAVRTTGARRLLLNEYPSWRHRDCGLDGIHGLGTRVLQLLARALGADAGRSTVVLPSVEPEMRWLVSVAGEPAAGTPIGLDRPAGPGKEGTADGRR
jgi:hypothetical protein